MSIKVDNVAVSQKGEKVSPSHFTRCGKGIEGGKALSISGRKRKKTHVRRRKRDR